MNRKVTTMKGQILDIDLMKIKNQITAKEKDLGVISREKFVSNKRKRVSKRKIEEMANNARKVQEAMEQAKHMNNVNDDLPVIIPEPPIDNDVVDHPKIEAERPLKRTVKRG